MSENLTILCPERPKPSDQNVAKIARHFGVPFTFGNSAAAEGVVVTTWQALKESAGSNRALPRTLFVYGWDGSAKSNQFLSELTVGAIPQTTPHGSSVSRVFVAPDSRDFSHSLAGMDFEVQTRTADVGFVPAPGTPGIRQLIRCDHRPVLVELIVDGRQILLSGAAEIADLDSPVGRDFSLLQEFHRLAPLLMFMRKNFGARCWHSDKAWASFIIDDPLLRRQYGFLDYQKLLASMERRHFASSIAFIPWNHRRTDPAVAALFRAHPDRFSICVHGSDHTRREFGACNEMEIRHRTASALWRMEKHKQLSSIPFDPVMVFPQGLFSTDAMKVLGESRFLAAINSTPFPVNSETGLLTLTDLMEPVVTKFSNFPLFLRRYPRNLAEFAFDLFLGKPLLLVEHHEYFRDGLKALEEFVSKLNALDPSLCWTNPGAICAGFYWQRRGGNNDLQIRFYTDRFHLTNHRDQSQSYTLHRRAAPGRVVQAIKVNGHDSAWTTDGDYLKIPLQLSAHQRAEVTVDRVAPQPVSGAFRSGMIGKTKVFFRRHLSEFRDNFVDKSPLATRTVQCARHLLRSSHS